MKLKLLFTFISGAAVGVAGLSLILYRPQGGYVEASHGPGNRHCFGHSRAGVMTAEEAALFTRVDVGCGRQEATEFNDALVFPPEAVELSCVPMKPRFVEPELPVLSLQIKNVSEKAIFVLEPKWGRWIGEPALERQGLSFDWQDGLNTRARYVWRIAPGAVRALSFSPELDSYGDQHVTLAFGPWKMTGLTRTTSSSKRQWIKTARCDFAWNAQP